MDETRKNAGASPPLARSLTHSLIHSFLLRAPGSTLPRGWARLAPPLLTPPRLGGQAGGPGEDPSAPFYHWPPTPGCPRRLPVLGSRARGRTERAQSESVRRRVRVGRCRSAALDCIAWTGLGYAQEEQTPRGLGAACRKLHPRETAGGSAACSWWAGVSTPERRRLSPGAWLGRGRSSRRARRGSVWLLAWNAARLLRWERREATAAAGILLADWIKRRYSPARPASAGAGAGRRRWAGRRGAPTSAGGSWGCCSPCAGWRRRCWPRTWIRCPGARPTPSTCRCRRCLSRAARAAEWRARGWLDGRGVPEGGVGRSSPPRVARRSLERGLGGLASTLRTPFPNTDRRGREESVARLEVAIPWGGGGGGAGLRLSAPREHPHSSPAAQRLWLGRRGHPARRGSGAGERLRSAPSFQAGRRLLAGDGVAGLCGAVPLLGHPGTEVGAGPVVPLLSEQVPLQRRLFGRRQSRRALCEEPGVAPAGTRLPGEVWRAGGGLLGTACRRRSSARRRGRARCRLPGRDPFLSPAQPSVAGQAWESSSAAAAIFSGFWVPLL